MENNIESWISKEDLVKLFKYASLMAMCVVPSEIEKHYGCVNFSGIIPDLYRDIAWAIKNDEPIHISDKQDDYYNDCMKAITEDIEISESI